MKNTVTMYGAIYDWGNNPDNIHEGYAYGHPMYLSEYDLYTFEGGLENQIVGYYEVEITLPTENEFKSKNMIKSDAV